MNELKTMIEDLLAEPMPHIGKLEKLLAERWDDFAGCGEGGMEGHKLLGRMECIEWRPPLLTFVIERHGGTACGSTRAELQHWTLDLDAMTATITKTGHRQLKPMADRLSIKGLAQELVQAIFDGRNDERLDWRDKISVQVRASAIFPNCSGFQRTVQERRKRLCEQIAAALAEKGWRREGSNVFTKNQ